MENEEKRIDQEIENKVSETSSSDKFYEELGGAILFLLIGIYLIITSIQMPGEELTGNKELWYSAPGVFPTFVGAVLSILSVLLILQYVKKNKGKAKLDVGKIKVYLCGQHFRSLLIVLFYLSVYIFGLLGRVKFPIATFLFLSISMITFRKEKIAIWKLILISLLASAAITYGFGTLAKIPLL
mgnify:CR=1 FL=1